MKSFKLLILLVLVSLFSIKSLAQNITVLAGYDTTKFAITKSSVEQNLNGFWFEGDKRLLEEGRVRLALVGAFHRTYHELSFPEMTYMNEVYRNVNTYSAGLNLTAKVVGPLYGYGSFKLGAEQPHEQIGYHLVRQYDVGAQLKLGHFLFREAYQFNASGKFAERVDRKILTGVGFSF